MIESRTAFNAKGENYEFYEVFIVRQTNENATVADRNEHHPNSNDAPVHCLRQKIDIGNAR